ncbi:MAG: YfhO family protein [Chloroflexi bacterium]|nr:YfhO family protein [Chloroflexota bacterium]
MRRFLLHPFSFLLLVWLLFFWRYLVGQVTFPSGDFTYQFFVFRDIAYRALAAGHLPLWSDCFFAGYPFHADPQSQLFYPPIWISFALLKIMGWGNFPLFALTLETTFHYLLVSIFTFCFLRAELGSPTRPGSLAPLLGSITFTYGGYLTGYPPLQSAILETVAWLPLILLILHRLTESPITNNQLRLIAFSSITLALAFFAGHPQTFLFVAYLSVAYFIYRAAVNARPWRWTLTRLAAIFGLLFGLSLVQLLPQAQYLSLSTRASLTFEQLASGFSSGIVKQFLITDPVWSPLYVGILPLVLALTAVAAVRKSSVLFWLGVALVSLVLSLGGNTPLYTLAYYLLPGYRLFRGQERLAMLVSFSLATLAAYGLAAIISWWSSRGEGRGVKAVSLLIVGFTVLNLYLTRTSTNLVVPFDPYPYNLILDPIRADREPFFRVQDDARMQGHFACGYGFKEWGGISPIRPAAWATFDEHAPESLRWKVIGMKYLITWKNGALTRENELPPAVRVAEGLAPQGEAKVYMMYELPRRAWPVYQTQTTDDVFAALRAPGFDPFATAVIRPPSPLFGALPNGGEGRGEGAVTVIGDYPGHLSLTVTTDSPALLVISEAYYPGWAASVNGQPAPALEADAYLLAVPVPAGDSTVELSYRPITLLVGALVSLLSLAVCTLLIVFRPREASNL